MASREMIDVLQRLRELDEKNPNVHTDALENTEKLNPPVEEAKKKMVKDPKTGKMVPDYAIDGKGKDDLKKENVKESRTAPKEVKKLMAGHTYTCEDCGCEMHKCDKDCDCKYDSHDEMGSWWKDENGNGIPDVKESVNESITISADSESDLPMIAQIMKLAGMKTVTPDMMPDADNVPMMKSDDDINANNDDDCGCEDEDTEEGFANSMGDEKEEPTYKGYDPEYAKDAGAATRKTKQVPANSGDNPLEAIENNLKAQYEKFKK